MSEAVGREKAEFANDQVPFVNETLLSFTLRRWRETVFSARFVGLVIVLTALLVLAGPFGTLALPFPRRLAYWFLIVTLDATLGIFFVTGTVRALAQIMPPVFPRILAGGLVTAFPIALSRILVEGWVLGVPTKAIAWPHIWVSTAAISLGISAIFALARTSRQATVSQLSRAPTIEAPSPAPEPDLGTSPPAPAAPSFLDRLPAHLGRDLLYISMQDHYVDAHTRVGHTLVLMRLADAIRELDPASGLQIHRSHWVARGAIDRVERRDGRLTVVLSDGTRLPVSRSYVEAVKAAGLPGA
jgi:DNA-binding LytR/AlgR family response regulator